MRRARLVLTASLWLLTLPGAVRGFDQAWPEEGCHAAYLEISGAVFDGLSVNYDAQFMFSSYAGLAVRLGLGGSSLVSSSSWGLPDHFDTLHEIGELNFLLGHPSWRSFFFEVGFAYALAQNLASRPLVTATGLGPWTGNFSHRIGFRSQAKSVLIRFALTPAVTWDPERSRLRYFPQAGVSVGAVF